MLLLACESNCAKAAARRLLALALEEECGLTDLPPAAPGPYGKPYFPGYPHLHFSLSHSGPYALCALSDAPVGVDIEALRPRNPALPAKALSPPEYRQYLESGGDWPAFYTLWTRKESWCKQRGRGVARPGSVCPPLPGEHCKGIALSTLSGPGWRAAVCAAGPLPPLRWVAL